MSRLWPSALLVLVLAGILLTPIAARANERHFSYTYESAVLAPGEKELEVWTTGRGGRDTRYTQLDERLEFEIGLLPGLQTSVYLNFSAIGQEAAGELVKSTNLSVSNEWKWRVLDSTLDAVGLALFCVTGAVKADEAGLNILAASVLGTLSGIGGGMLRDVVAGRVPVIFRGELYATPAFAGALIATVVHHEDYSEWWYALAFAVCLGWRLVALKRGWTAPLPPGIDHA